MFLGLKLNCWTRTPIGLLPPQGIQGDGGDRILDPDSWLDPGQTGHSSRPSLVGYSSHRDVDKHISLSDGMAAGFWSRRLSSRDQYLL